MNAPGHLYIITAPSGAGKTTLVHMLLDSDPGVLLSISTTTRLPRAGEQDGVDYHFTTEAAFFDKAGRGEFIEWAKIHGNYYGTSKSWIEAQWAEGRDIVLEIDWQGAKQIRETFPWAIGVFILPPSVETLAERLHQRGTETESDIARRVGAAREEMRHVGEFDYVIINDDLLRAFKDLVSVIAASRLRLEVQQKRYPAFFKDLSQPPFQE